MLFELGRNPVQVQRWLGHHSAAFTLKVYAHLMDDGIGEAFDLDQELGDIKGTTGQPETDRNVFDLSTLETAA